MSGAMQPAPIRNRYEDYAPKLFRSQTRRRGGTTVRARETPPARARQRTRARAARLPSASTSPATLAVAVALGVGLVWLVQAGEAAELMAYARPDPRDYRGDVQLLSIDRVGEMFYGVVSQGYFLEHTDSRRDGVNRLIARLRREGYTSLYLAEASGRTVVRWNGRVLEIIPDSNAGS